MKMSQIRYLREQAARAERLARSAMDALTIERLIEASREYRLQADRLEVAPNRDADELALSLH
jgi:hypothetical protein